MSVTFAVDAIHTGEFTGDCYASGESVEVFRVADYAAALVALAEHKSVCDECRWYGIYPRIVLDVDESLNVANLNAVRLAEALGFALGEDLCGSMDAETFLLHVIAAAGEGPALIPTETFQESGTATLIVGGFTITDYLDDLHSIATEAVRLGREVTWG
jgi:hypothetical protein